MPQPDSRDNRQRGLALLSVLWISVLLAFMSTAASRVSRTDVVLASNTRAAFAVERAARSAMDMALYTYMTGSEESWYIDGTPYGWIVDGIKVRLSVSDERWRVDLNAASEEALTTLFDGFGEDDAAAARRAADLISYRQEARRALNRTTTEAQDRAAGFFAFGLVDEIALATDLTEPMASRAADMATVYTGLETPLARARRAPATGAPAEDAPLSSQPTPLTALAENPPESSAIVRIRAEAVASNGARYAYEAVVDLAAATSREPYVIRLLRRSEQALFDRGR